jgi:hypothetical protein
MTNKLKIGDKLLITCDRLGTKLLCHVKKGDIVVVTGFSNDGKILYHHNSLALPVNSDIYIKLKDDQII